MNYNYYIKKIIKVDYLYKNKLFMNENITPTEKINETKFNIKCI